MSIEIQELSAEHDAELVHFLDELGRRSPSVLGYHYPFYREMLQAIGVGEPVCLGARAGGRLVGVLPVFTRGGPAGPVYCSMPFFGPNAGVLCGPGPDRRVIHAALLNALLDRARASEALACTIYTPLLFDEFDLYDAVMPEAIVVEKFTQYLDPATADWSSCIARNLNKARRSGLEISTEITPERVEAFYGIYAGNCGDLGVALRPRRCIETLAREAATGGHAAMYFALHEGVVVAGLLVVRSPVTVSYYIPCTLTSARTLQPGVLLIDRAMADARARGIRVWNWEGSPSRDSGVYRFKKKWGSRESAYRIYVAALRSPETYRAIGSSGLASHYPYFFVYPYDRLVSRPEPGSVRREVAEPAPVPAGV